MEKLVLMLLRSLLVSKAMTAVQVEHRLLTEEDNKYEAAKEEGAHDAYLEIAHLIDDLIRDAIEL